jgi:uncharacterized lipoprotein NlpE involved in copper resistance
MKHKFVPVAIAAVVLIIAGCQNAQKMSADAALKSANLAFAAVKSNAEQYVPDQTKALEDSIQTAQTEYSSGKYSAALASAKELPGKINDLTAAASAKKAELTTQWKTLDASMPKTMEALQHRVNALKSEHKLSANDSEQYSTAKGLWGDASNAYQSGNLSDAVSKATELKDKLPGLEKSLGMRVTS